MSVCVCVVFCFVGASEKNPQRMFFGVFFDIKKKHLTFGGDP